MMLDRAPHLSNIVPSHDKLVVLAPHPDDESLGCGKLLARAFAGGGAHVICITDGSASHPNSQEWPPARLALCRRGEVTSAVIRLGGTAADVTWMGLPDAKLYQLDPFGIASDLLPILDACAARHIFVPAAEDHHEDHKVVAEVARILRRMRPDWSYYSYPVWCRWDDPDFDRKVLTHDPLFLDAPVWRAAKRDAIAAHQSQLGQIVCDDPSGFTLPSALIEKFVDGDEIFWRMP
ncbi:PIG-L deacetylase family protein [Roseovarius sp. Pro17]|uniref:PIG-L deacetylase family protein n=1 Tax=Roseovarius sp. Pro17 TaxID=3108175 RepID=UPI002D789806|nr:PIG-L deacetylase family protein [Roseovarius sp. Pro17]